MREFDHSLAIEAPAARILDAFFNADDLAAWWHASSSMCHPRSFGNYAIEWPPGLAKDELLGRMGGVFRGPGRWNMRSNEHNIVSDPEAAQVVFSANPRCTLVPLDVTLQTVIRPADVARIRAESTPFREAVADQIERYPRFQQLGYTYLHDPLAVAMWLDPSLGRYEDMRVEVETAGRVTSGMTVPVIDAEGNNPVRVALDVDVARAEEFIVSRIAGP